MATIKLEIKSCAECPHQSTSPYPTKDSFERPEYWWCNQTGEQRKIAGYVEWNDKIDIPEWCPILERKKEKVTLPVVDPEKVRHSNEGII